MSLFLFLFIYHPVGFVTISVMNAVQTIMVDLLPGQSSSVTACVGTFHFYHSNKADIPLEQPRSMHTKCDFGVRD